MPLEQVEGVGADIEILELNPIGLKNPKSLKSNLGRHDTEEENISYFPQTMEQGKRIADFCSTNFQVVTDKYSHLVVSSFIGKNIVLLISERYNHQSMEL